MRCPAILLVLASVCALADPAGAQIAERHRYEPISMPNPFIGDSRLPGPGLGRDLRDIEGRIDRARDNGFLSRREARQLRREARVIASLAGRYAQDGLSGSERRELENRTFYLRGRVAAAGP